MYMYFKNGCKKKQIFMLYVVEEQSEIGVV